MLGTRGGGSDQAPLARQHLLARAEEPVLDLLERLMRLQAQEPQEPYVGVWSRLRDVAPGRPVRTTPRGARPCGCCSCAARCTSCRPATACACANCTTRCWSPACAARSPPALPGVNEEELAAAGRPLFAATPSTLTEVARAVGDRWPQVAARDLGDALSTLLRSSRCRRAGCGGRVLPPAAPRSTRRRCGAGGRHDRDCRGPRAPLPRRLRPCGDRRHPCLVLIGRAARRGGPTASAAPHVPRRARSRPSRRARRSAARP